MTTLLLSNADPINWREALAFLACGVLCLIATWIVVLPWHFAATVRGLLT